MSSRRLVLIGLAGMLIITSVNAAQRRRFPTTPSDTTVDVAIALRAEGQPYEFNGKAVCEHAPVASIYGVGAEMWSVQQSDGQRSLTLTVWRPKDAHGDWFVLSVTSAGKSHMVNTVKAPGAGAVQGAGRVTLTRSEPAGTFAIDATTAKGGAITGTIKCSAFMPAVAEGGE